MPYHYPCSSVTTKLANIVSMLIKSSLQPSSVPTYRRAWNLFHLFLSSIFQHAVVTLPISPSRIALFIAYLYDKNYAPSTVNTYVSAIGYTHKLYQLPDPSKAFFVLQLLRGYNKVGFRLDARLPITLPILHKLFSASPHVCNSPYQIARFKAMCALAFFAFLRVGEMTMTSNNTVSILQLHNLVTLVDTAKSSVCGLKLTFGDYKHSYNQTPFSITISRQQQFCPVDIILDYLRMRGSQPGPLFITISGGIVSRENFCNCLASAFKFCGLDSSRYKGHSFRIGAASHAAEKGLSDTQIRLLGRWKSNAFLKYIRVPNLAT